MEDQQEKKYKIVVLSGDKFDPFNEIMEDTHWSWDAIKQYCSKETYLHNPISVIDYYNELRKRVKDYGVPNKNLLIMDMVKDFDLKAIYDESVLGFNEAAKFAKDIPNLEINVTRGTINVSRDLYNGELRVFQYEPQNYLDISPESKVVYRPWVRWPGEDIKLAESFQERLKEADVFVCIGVDLTNPVYAKLPLWLNLDTKVYILDYNNTAKSIFTKDHLDRYTVFDGLNENNFEYVKNALDIFLDLKKKES